MNANDNKKGLALLATMVETDQLIPEAKAWLANALRDISNGADPYTALGIKGQRGIRSSPSSLASKKRSVNRRKAAMSWLSIATMPIKDGGLGLTQADACGIAAHHFHFSSATLMTYLQRYRDEYTEKFLIH